MRRVLLPLACVVLTACTATGQPQTALSDAMDRVARFFQPPAAALAEEASATGPGEGPGSAIACGLRGYRSRLAQCR